MSLSTNDRIAILGASRGLGFHIYSELYQKVPEAHFFLSSRKILDRKNEVSKSTTLFQADFSGSSLEALLAELQKFAPTRIIYCAGGGPYGNFCTKKWSDHLWSLKTTFLFPAELIHTIYSRNEAWPRLRQIVVVGSSIAENCPDPGAASYAAAKHALRGLVTTIQAEMNSIGSDSNSASAMANLLLFSPGYMQTSMLPANSWPIEQGLAEQPAEVAKKLIEFIEKNN